MLRLSPTANQPVITQDTTSSVLHYTDGLGSDTALDISSLGVGSHDVFLSSGALSTSPMGSNNRNQCWVGSIHLSVPGKITCHVSMGKDRKWEVYNAFNQKPITLTTLADVAPGGVFEWTPVYDYPTWHFFGNDPSIKATIFTGAPELLEARYVQNFWINTLKAMGYAAALFQTGIGLNQDPSKPLVPCSTVSQGNIDDSNHATGRQYLAFATIPAAVGVNYFQPLTTARSEPGIVLCFGADRRAKPYPAGTYYLTPVNHFQDLTVRWMG